jgi:hypothetical protein
MSPVLIGWCAGRTVLAPVAEDLLDGLGVLDLFVGPAQPFDEILEGPVADRERVVPVAALRL